MSDCELEARGPKPVARDARCPSLFQLAWRGGATAARLHRVRPGGDALPWGTIDLARYPAEHGREARAIWTNGTFTEYASAAAFSALTTAMLECGAPIDLIAACADVVVDEMFHTELSARLTMELGGALPLAYELACISPAPRAGTRPLVKAAELAIVTSCVSEALSVPAMARSRTLACEPLVHAVLDRLLADEGPHARLGLWFLEWATACSDPLTDAERVELARIAEDTIAVYAPLWQDPACEACPLPRGLGGHDAQGKADLRTAVECAIARPLARHGIVLDPVRVAALVA